MHSQGPTGETTRYNKAPENKGILARIDMATPDRRFQRLLKDLRPVFAEHQFLRQGQNFVIESPECWGVVNFQRSLYSVPGETSFTVNAGVASKKILSFCGEPANKAPRHYCCHWESRIGQLIPGNLDRWWTLSDERSHENITPELKDRIVRLVIPVVRGHLSEDGILRLWEGNNPGLFEYPRLKYKSILLAERGELKSLPQIFERIREICGSSLARAGAEEHIARMKRRYCLSIQ